MADGVDAAFMNSHTFVGAQIVSAKSTKLSGRESQMARAGFRTNNNPYAYFSEFLPAGVPTTFYWPDSSKDFTATVSYEGNNVVFNTSGYTSGSGSQAEAVVLYFVKNK